MSLEKLQLEVRRLHIAIKDKNNTIRHLRKKIIQYQAKIKKLQEERK